MALHIIEGTAAPTTTPTKIGQHFIDTVNKITYVSAGTSSSADWKISDASASIAAHVAAADPHPQYLTPTEANAAYDAIGEASTVQANLTSHTGNTSNPHATTKAQIGLGNCDNTSDLSKPISTLVQTALNLKYDNSNPLSYETTTQLNNRDTNNRNRSNHTGVQTSSTISDFNTAVNALINAIITSLKGAANGLCDLDGSALIPSSRLPAYVDDVLEFANLASFPVTGVAGKIYVDIATNSQYRWSGSVYVSISSGAVGSVFGRTGLVTAQANDYTWAQINKTVSSLADLATRSAADLNSGTLNNARLSTDVALKNLANIFTAVQTINTLTGSSILTIDAKNSTTDIAKLIFSGTASNGDFQISGDGGDIYWQGGGSRVLQMAAYHGIDLYGGRVTTVQPAFLAGSSNQWNTRILNTTDAIGLIIRANVAQTANLQSIQNSAGAEIAGITPAGNVFTQTPTASNHAVTKQYADEEIRTSQLTNIVFTNANSVLATDTTETAIGKLQAQENVWTELVTTAVLTNNSNVTLSNISDLQIPVTAGKKYRIEAMLLFRSTATTTGLALSALLSGGAVGTLALVADIPNAGDGTASIYSGNITASGDTVVSNQTPAANTDYMAKMSGIFVCTTSGFFTPQFRSEVNGQTVTVQIGSNLISRGF